MFFEADGEHFFKPLTGKHREIMVACLKALYQRLYSPDADYAYHLTREDLRDIFLEMIRETPLVSEEYQEEDDEYFRSAQDESAKANNMVRLLTDTGWIEKYMDKGSMVTAYRFTRAGKMFSESLFRFDFKGYKTRQRNVRNTKNALEAFLRDGDPYDLIDAVDYSQQVVSDLSDDISDLHERKSQLMKTAVQKISVAVEDFLQYMDEQFVPDLAIRLSADSVERHRHRIRHVVEQIQDWPGEQQALVKEKLAQVTGKPVKQHESLLERMLDMIQNSVESACLMKTPELRAALDSFVNRADLIIKQASALSAGLGESKLSHVIKTISNAEAAQQDDWLSQLGREMGQARIRLVDPHHIKLRKTVERRTIDTQVHEWTPSTEEQQTAMLRDLMDQAFAVSMDKVRGVIEQQLGRNGSISTSQILVKDVDSLFALSHAVEVASSANQGENRYTLEATGRRFNTPYLEAEEFIIKRNASDDTPSK